MQQNDLNQPIGFFMFDLHWTLMLIASATRLAEWRQLSHHDMNLRNNPPQHHHLAVCLAQKCGTKGLPSKIYMRYHLRYKCRYHFE
jgi:hypothetical protein